MTSSNVESSFYLRASSFVILYARHISFLLTFHDLFFFLPFLLSLSLYFFFISSIKVSRTVSTLPFLHGSKIEINYFINYLNRCTNYEELKSYYTWHVALLQLYYFNSLCLFHIYKILLIYYFLDDNEDNSVTADYATVDSAIFIGLSGLEVIEDGITKAFLSKIESITFKIVRTFTQIIQIKYVENYKIERDYI